MGPLDATLVSGVAVPLVRLNTNGLGWVEGPLHMLVVGATRCPHGSHLVSRRSFP